SARLGRPPAGAAEDDPRRGVAEAVGYVENNRSRMDYPRYRRPGPPGSRAGGGSTIKQLNRAAEGGGEVWGGGRGGGGGRRGAGGGGGRAALAPPPPPPLPPPGGRHPPAQPPLSGQEHSLQVRGCTPPSGPLPRHADP